MYALIFESEVLLVARLVRVVLFTKQPFLGEGLDLPSFFCFCTFFLCSLFQIPLRSASSIDIFLLYLSKKFPSIYNPSRQLNVCCVKSKNIWLRFIASSSRTSLSYFYLLISILYFSNNSSLFAILMHGLMISNGFIFLR